MPVPWFVSRVVLPCLAVLALPWVLAWLWALLLVVWRVVAVIAVVYVVAWVRFRFPDETDPYVFVVWLLVLLGLVGWWLWLVGGVFLRLFGLL